MVTKRSYVRLNKSVLKQNKMSKEEKCYVGKQIKDINEWDAIKDFKKLQEAREKAHTFSPRSRVGNDSVDFFTLHHRLETKGKYNMNFFDFLENLEVFKKKNFVSKMWQYYETVKIKKNIFLACKEIYNVCISSINIFRPLNAMEIFAKYKPTCVLDPCAGWGSRLIGALAYNVPKYIGIEINKTMFDTYKTMVRFYRKSASNVKTTVEMHFKDCTKMDYFSFGDYDMVFTSPPYYFIEKYPRNVIYESKEDMRVHFYNVFILNSWAALKPGGHFVLNVNQDIYKNCCISLLGEADEIIPLKKSQRQNNYTEFIYVWKKPTL